MIRLRIRLALPMLLTLLFGCTRSSAIWIVNPATTANLEFGIALSRGSSQPVRSLGDIRVTNCSDERYPDVFWEVRTNHLNGPSPIRIRYGVAPAGFETFLASKPLPSGCYSVHIEGEATSASTKFEVRADGSVAELPRGQPT